MKSALLLYDQDSRTLAQKLARRLKLPMKALSFRHFPDGETLVRVPETVKERRVILLSTMVPPDPKIFPLYLAAAACREMGAREIIWLAPYLPYMRQDKAFKPGQAVAAKVFAELISHSVDCLMTVDPHLHRIHDLNEIYSIPTRTVSAVPLLARYVGNHFKDALLIGPDAESKQWVQCAAQMANLDYLILSKQRLSGTRVRIDTTLLKALKGRTVILLDDIVSSGATMITLVKKLKKFGCAAIVCCVVHPLFVGTSYEDLKRSGADQIISCNTVPHVSNLIDMSPLLAEALQEESRG